MTLPQQVDGAAVFARILNDDYVSVPPSDRRRSDARLLQANPWQGFDVELELFNGHYLGIHNRLAAEQSEQILNLAYLNPRPVYQRGDLQARLRRVSLAALVPLLLAAFLQAAALPWVLLAVACLLLLAAMSAKPAYWVFHTASGQVPVCTIRGALLSSAAAEDFVNILRERIEGAEIVLPRGSRRLAAELAEHRRMLDSGCLSRRDYDGARQRLLNKFRAGNSGSDNQLA